MKRNAKASWFLSVSQEILKATKYRVAKSAVDRLFLGGHFNALLA